MIFSIIQSTLPFTGSVEGRLKSNVRVARRANQYTMHTTVSDAAASREHEQNHSFNSRRGSVDVQQCVITISLQTLRAEKIQEEWTKHRTAKRSKPKHAPHRGEQQSLSIFLHVATWNPAKHWGPLATWCNRTPPAGLHGSLQSEVLCGQTSSRFYNIYLTLQCATTSFLCALCDKTNTSNMAL